MNQRKKTEAGCAIAVIVMLLYATAAWASPLPEVHFYSGPGSWNENSIVQSITGVPFDGVNWTMTFQKNMPDSVTELDPGDAQLGTLLATTLNFYGVVGIFTGTEHWPILGTIPKTVEKCLIVDQVIYGLFYGYEVKREYNPYMLTYYWQCADKASIYTGGYVAELTAAPIQPAPEPSPVPEPSPAVLLCIGLICLIGLHRKFRGQIHIA